MGDALRHYCVEARGAGGEYRVRHRATGRRYLWRALDCAAAPARRVRAVLRDVRALARQRDAALLHYRDTLSHARSGTLYLVREHCAGRSLEQRAGGWRAGGRRARERFLWRLLHALARAARQVHHLHLTTMQKSVSASAILIDESGEIRVNFFELADEVVPVDLMRQVGQVLHDLCYTEDNGKEFCYSDDLKDVINFFMDENNSNMKPEVILYHPTVLANLETGLDSEGLDEAIVPKDYVENVQDSSKCDSEKALEVCKTFDKHSFTVLDSPVYANISPKKTLSISDHDINSPKTSLSPTLAALALELPGFVPRRRTIASDALARNEPQQISQRTLSNQWLSRLIALREREDNLNRRERDLISKEIVNSPNVKIAILDDVITQDNEGITLPPVISQNIAPADEKLKEKDEDLWISRRHHRRSSSVRTRQRRRQTYNYEDLDSSLSADPGDGSIVVTATKFNKENMPRRNIFPEVSTKKVHFTSVNPFVESDESVTLTFYELENIDAEGYQVPRNRDYTTNKMEEEISKFKYLDLEKATLEKRVAMEQWNQSSPNKQAKFAVPTNPEKKLFNDITNRTGYSMKKVPSKSSISSKTSNTSNGTKYSTASNHSTDSNKSNLSYQSSVSNLRSSTRLKNADKLFTQQSKPITRQSMLPMVAPEVKKPKGRKSLLPFKTPFKFMTSSKS